MSSELENIRKLIEQKDVQFRDFQIGSIETRASEDGKTEKMVIRGVAAVFDTETLLLSFRNWNNQLVEVYEQVSPDAFDNADMTDVIFNQNHAGRVYARTRNKSLRLNVNKEVGLEMETELWDDDEGHRQFYRDIKRGNIDKMSYAYIPKKIEERKEVDEEEGIIRYHITLKSVKRVLDVSAVDIPAYDATEISARRMVEVVSKILMSERQPETGQTVSGQADGTPAESRRAETEAAFELEKRVLLAKIGRK